MYTPVMAGEKCAADKQELLSAADYILNKADKKEMEVIIEAVERRLAVLNNPQGLSAINPEKMAKQMSESIHQSIRNSLDGVRNTFREFAADMLTREAPELTKEQMQKLIDSWLPAESSYSKGKSISKNGKINGIPASAMYEMILQFVSFSIGEMPEKENTELRSSIGDWPEKYWKNFPKEIQSEIRNFLHGESTLGVFQKKIKTLIL